MMDLSNCDHYPSICMLSLSDVDPGVFHLLNQQYNSGQVQLGLFPSLLDVVNVTITKKHIPAVN